MSHEESPRVMKLIGRVINLRIGFTKNVAAVRAAEAKNRVFILSP